MCIQYSKFSVNIQIQTFLVRSYSPIWSVLVNPKANFVTLFSKNYFIKVFLLFFKWPLIISIMESQVPNFQFSLTTLLTKHNFVSQVDVIKLHSIEINHLNELERVHSSKLWRGPQSAKQSKYFIPVVALSLIRLSKKQDWAVMSNLKLSSFLKNRTVFFHLRHCFFLDFCSHY